ncbi:Putative RxLR effector [Phytophthora palmivora]|uniref:RxLR effector protein n=1 Tax=Phytophthora palmivora TaxID=4796 RepID=A0A2P4XRC4_9STRA|nr:Putative RxLR effector [Phytophthora palmivora]POM78205.1 Putative RxLR effector [Phytophthora palmivora]
MRLGYLVLATTVALLASSETFAATADSVPSSLSTMITSPPNRSLRSLSRTKPRVVDDNSNDHIISTNENDISEADEERVVPFRKIGTTPLKLEYPPATKWERIKYNLAKLLPGSLKVFPYDKFQRLPSNVNKNS